MGKKKIKVEQAQADTDTKQGTFSKHQMGVFKKASKLATICNTKVGIVVCSPGDKPYTFGKPNFDLIADLFKNESQPEAEKKEGGDLQKRLESAEEEKFKFDKPLEELTLEELNEFEAMLMKMQVEIQGLHR